MPSFNHFLRQGLEERANYTDSITSLRNLFIQAQENEQDQAHATNT